MKTKYSLVLLASLSIMSAACTTTSGNGMTREITFAPGESAIPVSQQSKVADIASYMFSNPSEKVKMDNRQEEDGTFARTKTLSDVRQDTIRKALMDAGVDGTRIQTAWHDRDRLVEAPKN